MRITQEADYALRIVSLLAGRNEIVGAPAVSEAVAVPPRFALKILRKLSMEGLVQASRGASGGYSLSVDPRALTVRRVIEIIDGPIEISKCLSEGHTCLNNPVKTCCRFHNLFDTLNQQLVERLDRITIAMMVDGELPLPDLLDTVK